MKKVIVLSLAVAIVMLSVAFTGCGGKSIYDYETVAPSNVTTAAQLITDENGRVVETTAAEETEDETEPADITAETEVAPE